MIYCEQCGAANDIMNEQCHRCGLQLASSAPPLVPAASGASTAHTASLEIGKDLELPDWLKRAAAETPPASVPAGVGAEQLPPPGFRVAGSNAPRTTDDLFTAEAPPPMPRPLPPVPTAGLPSAMPDWLRSQPAQHAQAPEPDATDTSSFISESDLPEWIRQIAEADAAKKAAEERAAAEPKHATAEASSKPVHLPGESAPSVPAANPWLTRREAASPASSWGTPAPQPVPAVSAPPEPDAQVAQLAAANSEHDGVTAAAPVAKKGLKLGKPSVSLPSRPKIAAPSMDHGSTSSASGNNLRAILLAALVVLLVILAAGMLL